MEENQSIDINKLVAAASGVDQNTVPEVVKFADIELPAFQNALREATGGEISDLDSLHSIRAQIKELPSIQSQLQELRAASAIDPFANPLVKKLNEIAKSGAGIHDFETYVRLAKIDPAQMSTFDLLKTKFALDPVGYTSAQIDALIETQYGLADGVKEQDLPAAEQAKLAQAKYDAISFLNERKVSYEPTQSTAAVIDPNIEIQQQQIVSGWEKNILPALKAEVPFTLPADTESGRPEYNFAYTPSGEVTKQVNELVMQQIRSNPGAFPLTEDGVAQVRQLHQNLLIMADPASYQKALFLDVYNTMRAVVAEKNAGKLPVQPIIQPTAPATQAQVVPGSGKGLTREQLQRFALNK